MTLDRHELLRYAIDVVPEWGPILGIDREFFGEDDTRAHLYVGMSLLPGIVLPLLGRLAQNAEHRAVVELPAPGSPAGAEVLQRVFALFDTMAREGDRDTVDVIHSVVLEGLMSDQAVARAALPWFGPALLAEARQHWSAEIKAAYDAAAE